MDDLLSSVIVNESEKFFKQSQSWLINLSEIKPGNSVVLGGNKVAFYAIHYIDLLTIVISVISSAKVIASIYKTHQSSKRWDFSDRFPLYLAIADGSWGLVNFASDHIFLAINETIPDKHTSAILGLNVGMFLGYQQLMGAGLATYTYLKVVRRVSLDLGKYEWKLHIFCLIFVAISAGIFYPLGAAGCAGYWFLADPNSLAGVIGQFGMAVVGTICFLSTIFGYKAIKRVVDKQRQIMSVLNAIDNCDHSHSTAAQCLTTFVYVSICVNGLLSVVAWAVAIQFCFGVIDPLTCFVGVVTANSNGWANSWAYFHNKKIKEKRRLLHLKSKMRIVASSSNSNSGPGTSTLV